jgi:hypothetical protein
VRGLSLHVDAMQAAALLEPSAIVVVMIGAAGVIC